MRATLANPIPAAEVVGPALLGRARPDAVVHQIRARRATSVASSSRRTRCSEATRGERAADEQVGNRVVTGVEADVRRLAGTHGTQELAGEGVLEGGKSRGCSSARVSSKD